MLNPCKLGVNSYQNSSSDNLSSRLFKGRWHGQGHDINAPFHQFHRLVRCGLTANAAQLSHAVMHGSGLISKTLANVFGVCKNVAYSLDE